MQFIQYRSKVSHTETFERYCIRISVLMAASSVVVPALFVVLSSPVPLLRHSALACMRLVQEALNEREASSCCYYQLCCLVCENSAEIETDHNRVAQLVARESTSPSSSVLSCVLNVVVDVETPPNARVSLLETCRLVDCEARYFFFGENRFSANSF